MSDPIKNVTTAMRSVDDDIAPEVQRTMPSFAAQVLALAPGETAFRGYRMDQAKPVGPGGTLASMRVALRNAVAPVASKTKTKTGGDYEVSISSNTWLDDHIYIVAAVTRVDNGVSNG